jgi:hypothetical protein
MWSCANSIPVIEEALGIQFRHHHKKYGRVIVPDSQLTELLESIKLLPDKYDGSIDLEFENKINSDGWRVVSSLFSKQEALLVAIMSLSAENWKTSCLQFLTSHIAAAAPENSAHNSIVIVLTQNLTQKRYMAAAATAAAAAVVVKQRLQPRKR